GFATTGVNPAAGCGWFARQCCPSNARLYRQCLIPVCRRGLAAGAADVIVGPYSAAVAGLNPAAAACGRECNHESSSAAAAPGNGWLASGLSWPVSDGYGIRHRG